ncbi:MAG: nucleotidyl transferase [Legionellales bacterium RIFCSPHIGHO2_12_FULL_37_14]|nr:MAG: nucleotidyl transferase [Legionellales bacterium RIFCSPHIGHO2_12_FULL_37_14]
MLPVAILAGGLATRLRPITEKIPKSLLEVAGEPFIFHQLRALRKAKIERVVLLIGYLGNLIQEKVKDGAAFGLKVSYVEDGPELLGTGGALLKALPTLGEEFFVLYGDSFLPINYANVLQAFKESNKLALLTVMKNNNQWDKSNVIYRNNLVHLYAKKTQIPAMEYIDYGLGILTQKAFTSKKTAQKFDLATLYFQLSLQKELAGHEVFERFYEIGSPKGLEETTKYLVGWASAQQTPKKEN